MYFSLRNPWLVRWYGCGRFASLDSTFIRHTHCIGAHSLTHSHNGRPTDLLSFRMFLLCFRFRFFFLSFSFQFIFSMLLLQWIRSDREICGRARLPTMATKRNEKWKRDPSHVASNADRTNVRNMHKNRRKQFLFRIAKKCKWYRALNRFAGARTCVWQRVRKLGHFWCRSHIFTIRGYHPWAIRQLDVAVRILSAQTDHHQLVEIRPRAGAQHYADSVNLNLNQSFSCRSELWQLSLNNILLFPTVHNCAMGTLLDKQ